MKPSKVIKVLLTAIRARLPVHLWGPPGTAKSAVMNQLPKILNELQDDPGYSFYKKHMTEDGWQIIDIRAAQFDPVDLRGIPVPNIPKMITEWFPPGFWPTEGCGIIFLDELSGAPPAVQLALYQLVLDRRMGEYVLPTGWMVFAAGNRAKDRAVVHRMSTALANRFMHIHMDVDPGDWFNWCLKNNIYPDVIAFHKFREINREDSLLYTFDPTTDELSFASLRTWEYVSDLMWAEPPAEVLFEAVAGNVGEGPAREFIGFLAVKKNLPDLEMIEQHPETTMLPNESSASVAVAMALVNRADEVNMGPLTTYMRRLSPEYTTLFLKACMAKNKALLECREVIEWTSNKKNVELFRAA